MQVASIFKSLVLHCFYIKVALAPGVSASGEIPRGTAIATFDANDRYPTDALGRHAAIYLTHDEHRILVLDQWNAQGQVLQRPIWFKRPKGTKRSNDADTFYVIK